MVCRFVSPCHCAMVMTVGMLHGVSFFFNTLKYRGLHYGAALCGGKVPIV